MASYKLTKAERAELLQSILTYRFNQDEVGKFQKEYQDLVNSIYEFEFKKFFDDVKNIPLDYFPVANQLSIKFGTNYVAIHFNGNTDQLNKAFYYYYSIVKLPEVDKILKILPQYAMNGAYQTACIASYDATHKFSETYSDITNRVTAYINMVNKTRIEVKTVLDKASTTKQLENLWPESKPFINTIFVNKPTINVPSIPVEQLNKMIGLPMKESV